ncbi:MAG: 30S ribosomal protein S4 [Planctomycetaceae bacterium]|nr:MAG: 30S ribosomal protein S4 [Planctomycetaceae bacterium]
MGRYLGPKARVNRRLGFAVYENRGATKALEKRPHPPGMAGRGRKLSSYGEALAEKQKIKHHYGIREAQFRRYFAEAKAKKGNTGDILLTMCERRLDNVIRRAGFTLSRLQARQGIVHRHFQLNGKTVDIPSILVKPGDVITVRNRPNIRKLYQGLIEQNNATHCEWIEFDAQDLTARVVAEPQPLDVSIQGVKIGKVVAFLSR